MKKSRFTIGALIMSTMISVSLLMPVKSYGQGGRTDGFFSNDSEGYNNRDEGATEISGGITNDPLGAPLGSGLLIMTAAGAGYVLMKKRRRTLMTIVGAVLMLGMTQCKKHDVLSTDKQCVKITLDVAGGTKLDVNTATGVVEFTDGDEIIVANAGRFVGKLTFGDEVFSGFITDPSSDDYLHFYNFGNTEIASLEEGVSTECSISISDQINGLPVISYGCSSEKYSSATTNYVARLQNKCALVKFNVSTMSTFAATIITGMNNKVTVDFNDASFTYSMEDDGKIALPSGTGDRWVILLPQNEVSEGVEGSAFSGRYKGNRGAVPQIHADDRLDEGIDVVMNTLTQPEGALTGLFTINEDGKQVVFAKSNLAYVKATKEWMFRNNQYSTVERHEYPTGVNCAYLDTITLFDWGQTGYNHGANSYQPYQTGNKKPDLYVYGDPSYNLYDCTGKADWGYIAIKNGGNANKQWRTLRAEEWVYIFTDRQDAAEKFGRATVIDKKNNSHKGVVILPDNWVEPYADCFTGGISVTCEENTYTYDQWLAMESAGAVFLPYSGYRYSVSTRGMNLYGMIWSSTRATNSNVYVLSIADSGYEFQRSYQRNAGLPTRLVCE